MEWLNKFKQTPYLFQYLYDRITTSIAFIPSLLALAFFLFTGLMFYLEASGMTSWLGEKIPGFLIIKSWNVAQAILTTLVGALISLMVFSFSMVMVLLNNAASNYSPRILPSLISDKFHQIVLGTYMGTITYCLLLVMNMTPNQSDVPLPSTSVLLAIFFGLTCLMLFIFFIHSISVSVQVSRILENLEDTTMANLKYGMISKLGDQSVPADSDQWTIYNADRSGYLKSIDVKGLHEICEKHDIKIRILVSESKFVLEGVGLFSCNGRIEEDLINLILQKFSLSINELAKNDHVIGFKQINEIAIKAMSPGINDPGTAQTALDHLIVLFIEKMKCTEAGSVIIKDGEEQEKVVRVWLKVVSLEELLTFILTPLRHYASHDLSIVMKMLELLHYLATREHCSKTQFEMIANQVLVVKEDALKGLTNSADQKSVKDFIDSFPNWNFESGVV